MPRSLFRLSRWLPPGVAAPWFSQASPWLAASRMGASVAMLPSDRSSSPQVAALRVATEVICTQLRGEAREQARLIRSGAADELTEADVVRMARDIATAAGAQLDAAAPHCQRPSADPELQATRREAGQLMAAAPRQVDAELRKAWRARHEKAAGSQVAPLGQEVLQRSPPLVHIRMSDRAPDRPVSPQDSEDRPSLSRYPDRGRLLCGGR